jgi:amino acid transporter
VCATPTDHTSLDRGSDMATLFFASVFGSKLASRIMSAIISLCIAGNIVVMTFTAARVKQEIAKEGILPFSLFFASAHTTPDAWLRSKLFARHRSSAPEDPMARDIAELLAPERTPTGALVLHWLMSVLLIAVTAKLTSSTAYNALVFLYSYVLVGMVGLCVAGGLLYLYARPAIKWQKHDGPRGFRPLGGPAWAVLYFVTTLFVVVTAFLPPAATSPFTVAATGVKWYILPAIGLSAGLWGAIWWLGLHAYMRGSGLQLVVERVPHIALDDTDGPDAEWFQRREDIRRDWISRQYAKTNGQIHAEEGKGAVRLSEREISMAY